MEWVERVTEHHMGLAFLRAEARSPRFGELYQPLADAQTFGRLLGDGARLDDGRQNEQRALLLAPRGYRDRVALFAGFPYEVGWHRCRAGLPDLARLRHLASEPWESHSRWTFKVAETAARVRNGYEGGELGKHVRGTVTALSRGTRPAPIIVVGRDEKDELVVLEGNVRAVAFLCAPEWLGGHVEVLVGLHPSMTGWAFYRWAR